MEKYWFKTDNDEIHGNCIEPCQVKNDGTMIGSAKCQECEFCRGCGGKGTEFGFGPDWIQCSKLEEARGVVLNFAHELTKEPLTEALNKHNVMGRSELLPPDCFPDTEADGVVFCGKCGHIK